MVGHAVRAMYLMAGVADVAHEYDDPTLLERCKSCRTNLVYQRMYLTGGIGPSRHNEGFTTDYDLPDETAYAETCASIALILWNQRMLQFRGEGKYADIIEETLYNGFISGLALDGKNFFYVNPLASAGKHHRTPWFECPWLSPECRATLAILGNYLYSTGEDDLWVHLYAQNSATLTVDGVEVGVRLRSRYPWDGDISEKMKTVVLEKTLHLRIPGWCEGWRLKKNGAPVEKKKTDNGYVAVRRKWEAGDRVELSLDMAVQAVWAHPAVRQMQGRIAIQRGPVVYCLEGVDHAGVENLDRISFSAEQVAAMVAEYRPDLLDGVAVLHGFGNLISEADWNATTLYRRNRPSATETIA